MRSVPVRISLTTTMVGLVLLISAAILFVSVRAGRRIAEDLTDRYLGQTEARVEEQIDGVFAPVLDGLAHLRAWARSGRFSPDDAAASTDLLLPLLRSYPWISSIATGDELGRSWRLGAEGEGFLARTTDAGAPAAPATFRLYDAQGREQRAYEEPSDFDPRTRPWYAIGKDALSAARDAAAAPVSWTEPFVLNTSKLPGISAVAPLERAGGEPYLVTVNVMLTRLSDFTSTLRPTEHGVALVLTEKGDLIGFPAHPRFPTPESRAELVRALGDRMPRLAELKLPAFDWLAARWDGVVAAGSRTALALEDAEGRPWRLGLRPRTLPGGLKLWIGAAVPEEDFLGEVKAQRRHVLLVSGGALLAAVLLALLLGRAYARPLAQLAEESARIRTLDLAPGEPVRTHLAEARRLAEAQESMRGALDSFARYVPTPVVKELLRQGDAARLGGSVKPLTVMFSDVRGFTTISEALGPDALTAHLAEYFEALMEIVARHGGAVDKMIGDAIMSLWGAPMAHADHAARAVRAALESRAWLEAHTARCLAEGKPPLATGFGLATGEAFVGNVGSRARLNYTALGDVANLSSRLEGTTKLYGVVILCDESVRAATGEQFAWRCVDVVAVKGKTVPGRIYEPLGEAGAVDAETLAFARTYEAAFEDHLARRFDAALARLATLRGPRANDLSVRRLADLCRAYAKAPPPADWDGVARLTTK
jgi:adenylate cyclase